MKEDSAPAELKIHIAHPARMYDYYLGGKDNFAADRKTAEESLRVAPEIRDIARENRAFMRRAVRFMVTAGIRQFLDIGTGLPTNRNVHEIAQEVAPDVRVVYVDNDPIVLVHARALLAGIGETETRVITADLRDPHAILSRPDVNGFLDFTKPVAIMLVSVLQFIPERDPEELVAPLREIMTPGSFLVISHPTQDFRREQALQVAETYVRASAPAKARRKAEIEGLFGDLQLVEPGLVQSPLWRPDHEFIGELDHIWMYSGVAQKM